MYERREVVEADPDVVVEDEPVVRRPRRRMVVDDTPGTTYVNRSDPVGNSFAASSLIQTIVWSVVVLVLLVVGILVLLHYGII
jgi:hypothetical protein